MKKLKLIFIITLITVITSCKKEPETQPGGCTLFGTFEQAECGLGYYGNYFIRLDDGTLLQPADSKVNNIKKEDVYNGMYVSLSYTEVTEESRYTLPASCINSGAVKVVITCIAHAPRMRCGTR